MQYVTRWRMQQARELLTHTKESIFAISERSGYQSEAAFRKVFKKHFGVGPGAVRKNKR